MRKRTKRWLGAIALSVAGAGGAVMIARKKQEQKAKPLAPEKRSGDVWARPGMQVTFRAELKPGRDASERTFRITKVLPSGRVLIEGMAGEHNEKEFEPIRF
jgi:hypothetical protein